MYQFTVELAGNTRRRNEIHLEERQAKFQSMFKDYSDYGIPESYYVRNGPNSQFDRHCSAVLDAMKKKWHPQQAKSTYLGIYAPAKWQALPEAQKHQHTLSECEGCHQTYLEQQQTYPAKPVYNPTVITVNPTVIAQKGAKKFAEQCTKDLNNAYQQAVGKTFVDYLVKNPKLGVEKRKTGCQKKVAKRKVLRSIRDHVSQQLADNATMSLLVENESVSKYRRKRVTQAFETPKENEPPSKKKKHSPSFDKVSWNKEKVLEDVRNWPPGKKINWSQIAREHNVGSTNAGQVVKELCVMNDIDVSLLDGSTPRRRSRVRKKRLPGGEISSPTLPPPKTITAEIQALMEGGRFLLGEACVPYRLRKYKARAGILEEYEVQVQGRKIALTDVRQKLLQKHTKYMRLLSDADINKLTYTEAHEILQGMKCDAGDGEDLKKLQDRLKRSQRRRTLVFWHDHGTLLGFGFILITLHTVYDTAVFLTSGEYEQQCQGQLVDLQSVIEQPEIHIIAMGSSSIEDQAALISDRVECLLDVSTPLHTSEGIEIHDHVKLFTGDHPAAQFERGTQMGGVYKCGSCGCKDSLMDDQAHALQCSRRSLSEIQSIATTGVFGKQPFKTKPFDKLKVAELRVELSGRGLEGTHDANKPELSRTLQDILRGVQRVPSLLLANPTQPLSDLNLEHYDVLDSEPLHDLKGHFHNIIKELPHILPEVQKVTVNNLVDANLSKDKVTGSDLRKTLIHLYLLLSSSGVSRSVVLLLQTAVKIGQILYSNEEHRTPRQVLQLYNNCWVHHELCRDLFATPKVVTRTAMFGTYLHSLTAHSPQQYEVVCQKSINTENQERLFGQARAIALATTNRQPQSIIPNILLRLQAKKDTDQLWQSVAKAESQVRSAAANLPTFNGTIVSKRFIAERKASWQGHLQRISPYLVHGEGIWWKKIDDGYCFADGDDDPNQKPEGPRLFHIRSFTIKDVLQRQKDCWDVVLSNSVQLPTDFLRLYDLNGEPIGSLTLSSDSTSFSTDIPHPSGQTLNNTSHTGLDSVPPSTGYIPPTTAVPPSMEQDSIPPSTGHIPPTMASTEQNSVPPSTGHIPPTTASTEQNSVPPSTGHIPPTTASTEQDSVPPSTGHIPPTTASTEQDSIPPSTGHIPLTTASTEQNSVPPYTGPIPPTKAVPPSTGPIPPTTEELRDTEEIEIIVPSHSVVDSSKQPTGLQTKHAEAIMQVLEECPKELQLLDSVRGRIKALQKSKKKPSQSLVDQHQKLLASTQQLVLVRRTHIQQQIQNWEKHFYAKHKRLPTQGEDSQYHKLLITRERLRRLLRSWKITI